MFLLFAWIKGLLYGGHRPTGMSSLLGFRSSGAMAAILLIYEFVEIRSTETRNKAMHWWKASFAAFTLIVFGSLTPQAGAVAGLCVVMVVSLDKKVQLVARMLLAGVALLAFTAWLSIPSFDLAKLPVFIANLVGRSESNVMSLTGRIPFWQGVWEIMKGEHFGLGFAAAERIIFIRLEGLLWEVGWATNAHSGFVSAWLSVGWPGLTLVLVIFAAVWGQARHFGRDDRAMVAGILVLLFLNNFTHNTVGGPFNITFMVMMALASAPFAARGIPRHATTARAQSLPAAGR